ncbi:MAG: poly-gamma-glutamate system protein [Armatimonadota bacterium]|nr:poly-gamma-glutamate system protein [Armatimonadota bacterium]
MAVRAWGSRPAPTGALVVAAGLSLLAAALASRAGGDQGEWNVLRLEAARMMAAGSHALADARRAAGLGLSPDDVNRTGLIGPATSPITSSVGVLSAKRTATNPNWAAVVTEMFAQVGVRPGDTVAVGFSGSFPGLNLAVIYAARAMRVRVLAITAVAASNWGATDPMFTWLDMEQALVRRGLGERSLAASVGGAGDAGADLPPAGVHMLRAAIERSSVPLIPAPSLKASVDHRMAIYDAAGMPIAAFVNVGGAQANLGGCDDPYLVTSGILRGLPPCPGGREGVVHRFLHRGIPVISLLNVRSLAVRYGLPIDPIPLPPPGSGSAYGGGHSQRAGPWLGVVLGGWALLWALRRI